MTHLLFAEDTFIFCGDESEQIGFLRFVLLCFEAVLGLKINFGKSEMALVGDVHDIEDLASVLRCKISTFPLKYLGLPLREMFKFMEMWN